MVLRVFLLMPVLVSLSFMIQTHALAQISSESPGVCEIEMAGGETPREHLFVSVEVEREMERFVSLINQQSRWERRPWRRRGGTTSLEAAEILHGIIHSLFPNGHTLYLEGARRETLELKPHVTENEVRRNEGRYARTSFSLELRDPASYSGDLGIRGIGLFIPGQFRKSAEFSFGVHSRSLESRGEITDDSGVPVANLHNWIISAELRDRVFSVASRLRTTGGTVTQRLVLEYTQTGQLSRLSLERSEPGILSANVNRVTAFFPAQVKAFTHVQLWPDTGVYTIENGTD